MMCWKQLSQIHDILILKATPTDYLPTYIILCTFSHDSTAIYLLTLLHNQSTVAL